MKKIYRIFYKLFNVGCCYFDVFLSLLISRTLKSYGKNIIFGRFFSNKITSPQNITIGSNFQSGGNLYLYGHDGEISIGDNCSWGTNIQIGASEGSIYIGNDVQIASNVVIRAADHAYENPDKLIIDQGYKSGRIIIENDVWICSNCVILKNVRIGKGSVIAAGAVVTKDVEPFSVVAGIPAKKIKSRLN